MPFLPFLPVTTHRFGSERAIIFLIGAIQFINILDFMMVMPLGPDFARALSIPTAHLGWIAGSYTLAAAFSGLACSFFLEKFDRRKAIALALTGLAFATASGGFAVGLRSLMAARLLAGLFGGPATSLAIAVIADIIPPERRGRAMGAVFGAFSVASVVGVPLGLELARLWGWRMPFFAVAAMGTCVALGAWSLLPPLQGHLAHMKKTSRIGLMLSKPIVLLSYAMTATAMMAGFILIPNISAYLQQNLHYPRARLGLLYMVGGASSFVSMRAAGFLVDRYGSGKVATLGSLIFSLVVYFGFVSYVPGTSILMIFTVFMIAMAFRNIAYNTLTSKVPAPDERARFLSLQSTVQHLASAAGAFLSARLLSERSDGILEGIPLIAKISIVLTLLLPILMFRVERDVRSRKSLPILPIELEPLSQ